MKTREHKDQNIIDSVIKNCEICFVGLVTHQGPYVIPMNFGYRDGKLFLHSAPEGTAVRHLKPSPESVSVSVKGSWYISTRKLPAAIACTRQVWL